MAVGGDGGACDGAGEIGPGAACAIKRLGTTMEKAAKNPQKDAMAMFFVFKFASIAALPETHQIPNSVTVAGHTLPESPTVAIDGASYIYSCLLFAQRSFG